MISLRYKQGNVLYAEEPVIGFEVDMMGTRGGPIARQIWKMFPRAYTEHHRACMQLGLALGGAYLYRTPDRWYAALCTHPYPIKGMHLLQDHDTCSYPSYVRDCLINLHNDLYWDRSHQFRYDTKHIAIPKLGSEAGLPWDEVSDCLMTWAKHYGSDYDMDIVVYSDELPVSQEA
jgi:hypothetical protein